MSDTNPPPIFSQHRWGGRVLAQRGRTSQPPCNQKSNTAKSNTVCIYNIYIYSHIHRVLAKATQTFFPHLSGFATKPPMTSGSKVTEHRKNNFTVSVSSNCRILVIGHSNLRHLKGLPTDYQVECFPGAKFPIITDIVISFPQCNSVEHIVLAAGINHRDCSFVSEMEQTLNTCIRQARDTEKKVYYLGVSIPRRMPQSMIENLTRINAKARDILKEDFNSWNRI